TQRLRVHQPMLNRHLQQLRRWKLTAATRPVTQASFDSPIDRSSRMRYIVPHLRKTRPVLRLIARKTSIHRINPECKQPIEFGFLYWRRKKPLAQKVPVERLEMADIEDDAVPLRNRPLIQKLRTH